jgi:hypothetical protein
MNQTQEDFHDASEHDIDEHEAETKTRMSILKHYNKQTEGIFSPGKRLL